MPEIQVTNSTLEAMGPWLHDFALPAPLRVPMDPALRLRIRQRHDLILPRIREQFGESGLGGVSVLDLGANSGSWGRALAAHGAQVTCVEPRVENIAQAQLVARLLGDAGMVWVQDSAEGFLSRGARRFDVVLCLGLIYHAADAIGLFNFAASACGDLLVVDSHCINDDMPCFELRQELHTHPSQGLATAVTVPSRGAIYWLMRGAGFAHRMELPNIGDIPDDYRNFTRCAFLARRERELEAPGNDAGKLFIRDAQLDRVYPALGPAAVLARTKPRVRRDDFYQQLEQGFDR